MSKQRARPLGQIDGQVALSHAGAYAGTDAVTDLYEAWQSRVRVLEPVATATSEDPSDALATRLETALAEGHEQLADRIITALTAAVERSRHVPTTSNDASPRESVQQQLSETVEHLDEARREADEARADREDALARLDQSATDLATLRAERDSARDAEFSAATQRAVAMLTVLESLDDVVGLLRLRPDRQSAARLQQLDRAARAMAVLVELDEINTVGCVDPDLHEIVSTVGGKARIGLIVDVRQRGYAFRGRILRRAQVVVSARD